jgi:hypothetical protein
VAALKAGPPPEPHPPSAVVPALGAALILQVIGAAWVSNWTWGLATLGAWSRAGAAGLLLLGAAGFVPAIARPLTTLLERGGRAGRIADAVYALAATIVLFLLRDPLRFVGDSSLRMATVGSSRPPTGLFPQASPLDLLINFHLPSLLHHAGWPADLALQVVGACVGGAFVWTLLRTLDAAGVSGAGRIAAALVGVGGAHLVHFAGYDKFGPVLLGIGLAALGSVRLARGAGGALPLALGTATAVLSHRSGLLLVPPALWVFVRAWRADPAPAARRTLALCALVPLAALAVVVPPALRLFAGLDLKVHMPGGAVQRSLASRDAPGLLVRASDFVNGVLMSAPFVTAGIAAALALRGAPASRARGRFGVAGPLLLAFALQAGLLVAVGATRGSGRDWDVTTPAGTLAAIGGACALGRLWQRDRHGLAPAVTCAMMMLVALFGVHTSERRARRRVDALLRAHPAWSPTARSYAHDELGLRAFSLRRFDEAAADFELAAAAAPNPRYFAQLGASHAGAGRPAAAIEPFRHALALDPRIPEAWFGLANAHWALGDTAAAAAVMDSAIARWPRDPRYLAGRRALAEIMRNAGSPAPPAGR